MSAMAPARRALVACAALTAAKHGFPQLPQVTFASLSAVRMDSNSMPEQRSAHNRYQEKVFDEKSDFFASATATPPKVVPRLQRIATSCRLAPKTTLLDVGTGTGALLPFFQESGCDLSKVTGVDLSAGMLSFARERFPQVKFVQEDVLQFHGGEKYDRVVFNACFGNLYDPVAVLKHVAQELLSEGGLVVISHPLGRPWLRTLQEKDPRMVLHDLPGSNELKEMLTQVPELLLESLEDEADYYCLILKRR